MMKRWSQKDQISAIHRRDMELILRDLGVLDQITAGEVRCSECSQIITVDSIQCLFMEEGQLRVCCKNVACYKARMLARTARESGKP
jgi:hypothetical protein